MIQQIISGLEAGSWYSLIALAVVVVMKSTDVPNFAMADMGLVCAYVSWGSLKLFDKSGVASGHAAVVPFVLAIIVGLAFAAVFGAVIERVLMRPLGGLSHFPLLLMTIGLTFALESGIQAIWGADPQKNPSPWGAHVWHLGGQIVSLSQIITIAVGLVIALLLGRFFKSQWGARMRAVAENREVARLNGINVGRVSMTAWGLATMMAALAMILSTQSTVLSLDSGGGLIIRGFVAATIGGFSSLIGAFLGGLMVGVLEYLAAQYISTGSQAAVALLVVFVVLVFKPTGLFAPSMKPREV